ncbi:unnamed protein product [Acanthoscelides obtectus]|uniref:PiggyBac transposable element-derived protein domain-containing protein n=1 Tax=Acanthoscelides obtectus TaxID=200917 RepID=A0A9P0MLE4_ACAOB|nr:unnamed protein product [Acanthoscelides obtectus]CAK1626104.1 PiggyBac transposable element-derived protein 3 [Acanthoscelides obtectus]
MALKRYEDIKRYLHFINNEDISPENKDSFIKVRPYLDALLETFATSCTPTEYMAIDEMIIPFKSRSKNKEYIMSKPKKWGFKVWLRASADGNVSKFEIYLRLSGVKIVNSFSFEAISTTKFASFTPAPNSESDNDLDK